MQLLINVIHLKLFKIFKDPQFLGFIIFDRQYVQVGEFRRVNVTRVQHERLNKSTSFVTCAIFFLVLIRGGNLNKSTIICFIWTPASQITYRRGSSGILVMADTDKLNIDSIIARLLEGKFWLLDMSNNLSSSSSGWKRWKTVAITYAVSKTAGKTSPLSKY